LFCVLHFSAVAPTPKLPSGSHRRDTRKYRSGQERRQIRKMLRGKFAAPEDVKVTGKDELVAGKPWTYVENVTRPTMTVYSPQGKHRGCCDRVSWRRLQHFGDRS